MPTRRLSFIIRFDDDVGIVCRLYRRTPVALLDARLPAAATDGPLPSWVDIPCRLPQTRYTALENLFLLWRAHL